ncbi:uncharacterized protein K452DRAFT_305318 [Aplosporella prunicola CBS 121167]|uniref:Zinc-binding loop region of homing endonuclease domain-containing protein n=1 Tax=Aplosporella prunicola CBS 121167 TaxID=1176127 RepID=A0A6A6BSE8_9PEZI|nr:uncharacterized protein K452DRAFT_305318 [Aplosporella prunicola CBS 121167]KAF2146383.1 hypothetical protein K452DRAFT_305318 [Aplosporella prunicola CBS 121167]
MEDDDEFWVVDPSLREQLAIERERYCERQRLESESNDSQSSQDSQSSAKSRRGIPGKDLRLRKLSFLCMEKRFRGRLQREVERVLRKTPERTPGECWSIPRRAKSYERLEMAFRWWDADALAGDNEQKAITIQFGFAALLVNNRMTLSQMRGWLDHGYHLSHLCGNERCCNAHHFTVEPGSVNLKRRSCHSNCLKWRRCKHEPRCIARPCAAECPCRTQKTLTSDDSGTITLTASSLQSVTSPNASVDSQEYPSSLRQRLLRLEERKQQLEQSESAHSEHSPAVDPTIEQSNSLVRATEDDGNNHDIRPFSGSFRYFSRF